MRIKKDSWLVNKPIAHRGLWNETVPENSVLAYEFAAKQGIPIEIDVFLTKDEKIICFHDDTLERMTGANGCVWDYDYEELKKLKLNGSEYTIPLFDEVLDICCGKSPLLIEIKNQPNKKIIEMTVDRLKSYNGEFAIQSFNPLYINNVKKLAPDFIRGILATQNAYQKNKTTNFIIKNMSLNFLIKPDFISYEYTGLPLPTRKTKNKVVLAWTITDKKSQNAVKNFADNIIYENFTPN